MNGLISDAWAQAAPGAPSQFTPLLMVAVFFVIFYFMLFRPQQKRAKEHQNLISKLATEVGDTFVTLEIADGVRIKVQKTQITQLMPKGTLKSA